MSSLAATSVLALFWIIGTIRNFPVQEGNTECFFEPSSWNIYVIAIVDSFCVTLCVRGLPWVSRQSFCALGVSVCL
jgi:hypothetical protein